MEILNDRNFRFSIGRTWNNPQGNNVLHRVMDGMAMTSGFPFPSAPHFPPLNHRVNNQRNSWNLRDSRRYRARSNLSEMRRTIRRLRNKMHEAYDDLEDARIDLQEAREGLEDAKTEVLMSTNGLQSVVEEIDRVSNTLNTQMIGNHMNDFERNDIRRDLQTLRREVEDARRNIRYAEDDLDEDDPESREARSRNRRRNNRNSNDTANVPAVTAAASATATAPTTAAAPTTSAVPATQETNNNNPNSDLCSVCMEKPVNAVLYKCGHMCMCYQCAFKLHRRRNSRGQCPMCRAVIRDIIKTYKS